MNKTFNINRKTIGRIQYCYFKLWCNEGFIPRFWFLSFKWEIIIDYGGHEIAWQCTILGFMFGFKHELNPKHIADKTC
jgi:hypothetical protein